MPGITTFAGIFLIIAGKGLTIEIPADVPGDPAARRALCGGSQRANEEKEDDHG